MNEIFFDRPYNLYLIQDSHSGLKSPIAKLLANRQIGADIEIEYNFENESYQTNCENKDLRCLFPRKTCGVQIKDTYWIKDTRNGENIMIGNTCISRYVELNLLQNVNMDRYKYILETLATKNYCIACHSKVAVDKIAHKKCLAAKKAIHRDILCYSRGNGLMQVMAGVVGLKNIYGNLFKCRDSFIHPFSEKDSKLIEKHMDQYSMLYDNRTSLLLLTNNSLLKSIQTQRRYPSDKQLAIIDKIIQDYPRILKIDRENNNLAYQKYSYVYPRKSRYSNSV